VCVLSIETVCVKFSKTCFVLMLLLVYCFENLLVNVRYATQMEMWATAGHKHLLAPHRNSDWFSKYRSEEGAGK
jgi:hypothetical protein